MRALQCRAPQAQIIGIQQLMAWRGAPQARIIGIRSWEADLASARVHRLRARPTGSTHAH